MSLAGGGGGLKNCHFAMTNQPLVLLGAEEYEISIFRSDILFAWPLRNDHNISLIYDLY